MPIKWLRSAASPSALPTPCRAPRRRIPCRLPCRVPRRRLPCRLPCRVPRHRMPLPSTPTESPTEWRVASELPSSAPHESRSPDECPDECPDKRPDACPESRIAQWPVISTAARRARLRTAMLYTRPVIARGDEHHCRNVMYGSIDNRSITCFIGLPVLGTHHDVTRNEFRPVGDGAPAHVISYARSAGSRAGTRCHHTCRGFRGFS